MEPEGSLLRSQELSTGPYPKPDESSPYHSISLRSILVLSSNLHLGITSGLFPSGFRTKILCEFPSSTENVSSLYGRAWPCPSFYVNRAASEFGSLALHRSYPSNFSGI
jgi:hypothetical protein